MNPFFSKYLKYPDAKKVIKSRNISIVFNFYLSQNEKPRNALYVTKINSLYQWSELQLWFIEAISNLPRITVWVKVWLSLCLNDIHHLVLAQDLECLYVYGDTYNQVKI